MLTAPTSDRRRLGRVERHRKPRCPTTRTRLPPRVRTVTDGLTGGPTPPFTVRETFGEHPELVDRDYPLGVTCFTTGMNDAIRTHIGVLIFPDADQCRR